MERIILKIIICQAKIKPAKSVLKKKKLAHTMSNIVKHLQKF